jgi:hypothetical protein
VYSVGIGLYFLNLILDKVELEGFCQFYFIISTDYWSLKSSDFYITTHFNVRKRYIFTIQCTYGYCMIPRVRSDFFMLSSSLRWSVCTVRKNMNIFTRLSRFNVLWQPGFRRHRWFTRGFVDNNYTTICLSVYGSTALFLTLAAFQFLNLFTQSVGLLGRGISP